MGFKLSSRYTLDITKRKHLFCLSILYVLVVLDYVIQAKNK